MKLSRNRILKYAICVSICLLGFAGILHACIIPVFRYALERWYPDPFIVEIYSDGPLSAHEQSLIDKLDRLPNGPIPANIQVSKIDLSTVTNQVSPFPTLPWMVVKYPETSEIGSAVWSSSFNEQNIGAVLDSPARVEISRRLKNGETAVWIFVKSGDREKDEQLRGVLMEELNKLEQTLKLPVITEEERPEWFDVKNGPPLKLEFSILDMNANDPSEALLVAMLENSGEVLSRRFQRPSVYPVFGRGRALTGLQADQITAERIKNTCIFLTSGCSCEIKEMNPGLDLLMTSNWEDFKKEEVASTEVPIPLNGFPEMEPDSSNPSITMTRTNPASEVLALSKGTSMIQTNHPNSNDPGSRLLYKIGLSIVPLVLMVGVGSAYVIKRRE